MARFSSTPMSSLILHSAFGRLLLLFSRRLHALSFFYSMYSMYSQWLFHVFILLWSVYDSTVIRRATVEQRQITTNFRRLCKKTCIRQRFRRPGTYPTMHCFLSVELNHVIAYECREIKMFSSCALTEHSETEFSVFVFISSLQLTPTSELASTLTEFKSSTSKSPPESSVIRKCPIFERTSFGICHVAMHI